MTQLKLAIFALVGIYWTWAVASALRSGTVRHRQAHHTRADEPRTYWLTIAWHSALAILCFIAAMQFWGASPS